jgi:subtilisin family serine protease
MLAFSRRRAGEGADVHRWVAIVGVLAIAAGAATAASAQVSLPGVPLPQAPLPRLPAQPVTGTLRTANPALTEARQLRVRELLRSERETVETDPAGQPILRRQVGALSPTPAALDAARDAGFTVIRTEELEALGLTLVVLRAPEGLSTKRALQRLREIDPAGEYDYNHLYVGSGFQSEEVPPYAMPPPEAEAPTLGAKRIGLIDSGVDLSHPVLSGATIVRHGCDGALFPAPHGTAVASLLVGRGDHFESVLTGATLYAADIFCGHGGGSLSLLAVELDWMAREKVAVVNISLVGAKSILLTGLVRAMTARGFLLVAAVGNDGPTAPPLYPAAYPDVIGVTGVDKEHKVLPEACRGEQVDFAAAGADLEAAAVGGKFEEIRGTSFATPIVAGLLARTLQAPDPAAARSAVDALAATALDIGNNGTDPSYGKGLVGADLHPGYRE